METRRPAEESASDLLHHDRYTPEELARLLDMDVNLIRQAAFAGDLRAEIVGHNIHSIRRDDVLSWLAARE